MINSKKIAFALCTTLAFLSSIKTATMIPLISPIQTRTITSNVLNLEKAKFEKIENRWQKTLLERIIAFFRKGKTSNIIAKASCDIGLLTGIRQRMLPYSRQIIIQNLPIKKQVDQLIKDINALLKKLKAIKNRDNS